jgi:hypothetical protein
MSSIKCAIIAAFPVIALLANACHSASEDRAIVPTSDPPVACPAVAGPRASKDAESAIAHAKGVLASGYEKRAKSGDGSPADIARFEPYIATLKDGVWHVEGTVPPEYHGRVPIVSLCRNDEGATAEWTVR